MCDEDRPDGPDDAESAGILSEAPTVVDFDAQPPEDLPGGVLTPGQRFGSYEIIRLLGKGGMGEVYEAYDIRTERHVALKVLAERLSSETDRKRFLREGRLAAQVSHPNSVFVLGTEEIGGTQVIAMELMPGGTLKDRVEKDGPLPVREAVDLMLQLIAGLAAAAAKGVLHRDIKPSNCFVDSDGSVKVGDYGLSIPTGYEARKQLTASGNFVGTPAFASPEQLQGDQDIDTRSDIYSVGATLFWLLTGRPPFDESNPARLLARVLTEAPPRAHRLEPAVSRPLSRVLESCLEPNPEDRPSGYQRLRIVLGQHGSRAQPATLRRRSEAFLADMACCMIVLFIPLVIALEFVDLGDTSKAMARSAFLLFVPVSVVYFTIAEGIWGMSFGKAMFGLRVVATDRERPGIIKSLLRSVLSLAPILALIPSEVLGQSWLILLGVAWVALLLAMARAPGYIGPHDLLSGTRVVAQTDARPLRPETLPGEERPAWQRERMGPYQIVRDAGTSDDPLFVAYDDALRRHVWLRPAKLGAEPLQLERRALSRVGRLRWLNGRRGPQEAWDAFEFVPGQPFADAFREGARWPEVARWLGDLVDECQFTLSQERVSVVIDPRAIWLASTGRALILDFPIPGPGAGMASPSRNVIDATRALSWAANTLLEGKPSETPVPQVPLSGSARRLLQKLSAAQFSTYHDVTAALREDALQPGLTRFQRLGNVSLGLIFITTPWRAFFSNPAIADLPPFILGMSLIAFLSVLFALLMGEYQYVFMSGALVPRRRKTGHLMVVDSAGRKVTTLRLAARTLAAWSPGFLAFGFLLIDAGSPFVLAPLANLIALPPWLWLVPPALLLFGALFAVINPERGIQDRVAGTYLVPR